MSFEGPLTNPAQANWPVPTNEALEAVGVGLYAYRYDASTYPTEAGYGGQYGDTLIADWTVTLTNSTTNYVVANRSTGAVTVSTSATNWNDTTTYGRIAKLTTSTSAVTTRIDWRLLEGGILQTGSGAGAVDSVNGQTGAVVLDSFDIEHTDAESLFGSPSTVGNAIRDIAIGQYEWSGFLDEPEDKTYTLVLKAPFAGAILETTTDCAAGTGTATWSINGTPLGGTANTVSTSEQSQLHSSANTFVAGDTVAFAIVNDSPSILDLAFTVRYRRTWA